MLCVALVAHACGRLAGGMYHMPSLTCSRVAGVGPLGGCGGVGVVEVPKGMGSCPMGETQDFAGLVWGRGCGQVCGECVPAGSSCPPGSLSLGSDGMVVMATC
jgi:hypothetical protein